MPLPAEPRNPPPAEETAKTLALGQRELGQRVRQFRIEKRLTLRQVEERSGLSATHLSEIERGRTSPTIGALTRVARALDKDPSYFIEREERGEVSHVTAGAARRFAAAAGVTAETLTEGIPGREIFAYRLTFAGEDPAGLALPTQEAPAEALYLVCRGAVLADLGESAERLVAGSAAHGSLGSAHRLRGDTENAEVVAILTRPLGERVLSAPREREAAGAIAGAPRVGREAMKSPLVPVDPTPAELGRRIKLLRVTRGLTLKHVEQRGGISATHVSEIERGKASPTVGALARIACALDVRPATLVEPSVRPPVSRLHPEERAARRVTRGAAKIETLVEPAAQTHLLGELMTLPISPEPALTHRHEGEEWGTVLSGVVEITIDEETRVLKEGDSLHFRPHHTHSYRNLASTAAVLLVVVHPRVDP